MSRPTRALPPTPGSRSGSQPRHAPCSCAMPSRSWSSSSGSRPPGPRPAEPGRLEAASEASMGLRLIQGGRAADGLPGLLIENVAEIATMAGGLRLGVRMDDPALLVAPGGDTSHDTAPVVATWEGRILAA